MRMKHGFIAALMALSSVFVFSAKAGGTVALPKQEIGQGMGWIAAFLDTEGNLMGFHEVAPRIVLKKAPAKKAAKKK